MHQKMWQKLQRHILERRRWPVPKLQREKSVVDLHNRRHLCVVKTRRIVGSVHHRADLFRGKIVQIKRQDLLRQRLIAQIHHRAKRRFVKLRDLLGHIQPALRHHAAHDRLCRLHRFCVISRTDISHAFSSSFSFFSFKRSRTSL